MRSNTPLQALTLLNDSALFEIAQGLAARILTEKPEPASDRDRIQHGFIVCLGRPASSGELASLEALLGAERADDMANPTTAGGARRGAAPSSGPWVSVARVLLNLDEFVTRE
jgi:hypothetical protein